MKSAIFYLIAITTLTLVGVGNSTALESDGIIRSKPSWSPNGEFIVFEEIRLDDPTNFDIWLVRPDGTGLTNLTEDLPFGSHNAALSSDSRHLAFSHDRDGNLSNFDILVLDLETSEFQNLTNGLNITNDNPVWSPNGSEIAFESTSNINTNTRIDIWLVNLSDRQLSSLTGSEPGSYLNPVWSPMGDRLVFNGYVANEEAVNEEVEGIWAIDITTKTLTQLSSVNHFLEGWSSAGNRILARDSDFDLWTFSLETSSWSLLLRDDAMLVSPTWSPSGELVAFAGLYDDADKSTAQTFSDIWTINSDGSDPQKITTSERFSTTNLTPSWSPDGQRIVFVSGDGSYTDVVTTNVDGTDTINLTK